MTLVRALLAFCRTCLKMFIQMLRAFRHTGIANRCTKLADLFRELAVSRHERLCHSTDVRTIATHLDALSHPGHIHAATVSHAIFTGLVTTMTSLYASLELNRSGHCHDKITPFREFIIMANVPTKSGNIQLSIQVVLHPFKGFPVNFAFRIPFPQNVQRFSICED